MTVTIEVLPDSNIVLVRFRGEVDTQEHIAAFEEYAAHPLFDGHQHALLDLAECKLEDSYFQQIQHLAYRLKGYYEVRDLSSRTSIYAPGDVAFGMSRMYQSVADGISPWKVGVFRTRAEAMSFIGIRRGSPHEARVLAAWTD